MFLLQELELNPLKRVLFSTLCDQWLFPDVYFLTTSVTVLLFCFPTELYFCVYLTYHRTGLRFVLSNPPHDVSPQRGYPPFMRSILIGGIPLSWRQLTEGVSPYYDDSHPFEPTFSLLTLFKMIHSHPTFGSHFIELLLVAILNKLKRRCTSWRHFRLVSVLSEQPRGQPPRLMNSAADLSRKCYMLIGYGPYLLASFSCLFTLCSTHPLSLSPSPPTVKK